MNKLNRSMLALGPAVFLWLGPTITRAADLVCVVKGNGTELRNTFVTATVKSPVGMKGSYWLVPQGGAERLRATLFSSSGESHIGIVLDHLGANETRTFRARPVSDDVFFNLRDENGALRVEIDGKLFLSLNRGETKLYWFPVIGPTGAEFTRGFPMVRRAGDDQDHPHQRSFWITHGDVNGFDFWASDPLNAPNAKSGTIVETARESVTAGLALVSLRTEDDWRAPDGSSQLRDERLYRFSAAPGARFIDVDVTLRAVDRSAKLGDTKEGFFALRVPSSMNVNRKQGGRIVNAEGVTDQASWGKRSAWVDYSGPVEGETVGITIFNHPSSFRFPTAWHVRDYGLFAANPFGAHDFGIETQGPQTLKRGEEIRLSYRVLLHEGAGDRAALQSQFTAYASPPAIELRVE